MVGEAVLLWPLTTGAFPWGAWQAGVPTWFPADQAPGLLAARVVRQLTAGEKELVDKGRAKVNRALLRAAARKARPVATGAKPETKAQQAQPVAATGRKAVGTKGRKPTGARPAAGPAMPPPFPGPGGEL